MHRIDHATRAIDLHGPGRDGFTEGSPGVTPATVVTADILNAAQEEISNAIEARGVSLNKLNNGQLAAALSTPLTAIENRVRPDLSVRGTYLSPLDAMPDWSSSQLEWAAQGSQGNAISQVALGALSWGIAPGRNVPYSCTITAVRVFLKQASDYSAPNRMLVLVRGKPAADVETSTLIASQAAGAGTDVQVVELTGLSIPLVAISTPTHPGTGNLTASITVQGGNGTGDIVYMAEIRYTLTIL